MHRQSSITPNSVSERYPQWNAHKLTEHYTETWHMPHKSRARTKPQSNSNFADLCGQREAAFACCGKGCSLS